MCEDERISKEWWDYGRMSKIFDMSAPICPLDELKDSRVRLTEDDKCKATKRVRIKIGVKHKLENLGLTNQEASGVKLAYSSLKEYAKTKFNIT